MRITIPTVKGFLRRIVYVVMYGGCAEKRYTDNSAGWQGWVELRSMCVAFRSTDGRLFFDWD